MTMLRRRVLVDLTNVPTLRALTVENSACDSCKAQAAVGNAGYWQLPNSLQATGGFSGTGGARPGDVSQVKKAPEGDEKGFVQ
jgi:hypothetical protein